MQAEREPCMSRATLIAQPRGQAHQQCGIVHSKGFQKAIGQPASDRVG